MSTVRIILSSTVVMWTSTCCHPKRFFTLTLAYLIVGNTADNNLLVGQERTYLFITERSSEPRRVAFFIHCQHYLVHHIRILVICYGRVWAKSHRITSQGTFHNSKKSVRDNSSLRCDHNRLQNSRARSLFSASFQTFCSTARAYLNTQKYGLFCSLWSQCLLLNMKRSLEIWA